MVETLPVGAVDVVTTTNWAQLIQSIIAIVGALLGVFGGIYGAIQSFKAKDYKNGWGKTANALAGVAAAVELMPSTHPLTIKLKQTIRGISEGIGSEQDTLAKLVEEISVYFQEKGFTTNKDELTPEFVQRVVAALNMLKQNGGGTITTIQEGEKPK